MLVRKSEDRGGADFGWLNTKHSFSFGQYYDPRHMGHGPLRVLNEDRVSPGAGFDTHGHQDMEIISYVLDGALEHKDSLGTGSVIRPGDVQRMSAGTGVRHSEYNHSKDEPVHFLQIWIMPARNGMAPGYEQKSFAPDEALNRLQLLASTHGRDGSLTIHQDVDLYRTRLNDGGAVSLALKKGRLGWVQIARGRVELNGETLEAGDGAQLSEGASISLLGREDAEALIFDMAA